MSHSNLPFPISIKPSSFFVYQMLQPPEHLGGLPLHLLQFSELIPCMEYTVKLQVPKN